MLALMFVTTAVMALLSFAYHSPIEAVMLLLLSVAILAVGLLIYAKSFPVPDGLPQPWILRANVVAYQILAALTGKNLYDVVAYWHRSKSSLRITNTHFDGVPVRIYEQPNIGGGKLLPAVVYMHGGGFRCLSVDTLHPFTEDMAAKLNSVVISIEYRLSTKAVFPAAIDDCTKSTVWFLHHTEDYNVDCTRIAIMGESAGGNLAAGVAQRLAFDPRYRDLPKLRLQALICPMLQAFDFNTPSYQQYGSYATCLLPKSVVVASWVAYLTGSTKLQDKFSTNMHTSPTAKMSAISQKVLSHDNIPTRFKTRGYVPPSSTNLGDEGLYEALKAKLLDPSFAPLMRNSLGGLPEAYVITCTYDILRDDGILYVKKLEEDGVKVTWVNYDDGIHGMSHYSAHGPFALQAGKRCRQELFAFVNKILKA